jgi:hypothetical protein
MHCALECKSFGRADAKARTQSGATNGEAKPGRPPKVMSVQVYVNARDPERFTFAQRAHGRVHLATDIAD